MGAGPTLLDDRMESFTVNLCVREEPKTQDRNSTPAFHCTPKLSQMVLGPFLQAAPPSSGRCCQRAELGLAGAKCLSVWEHLSPAFLHLCHFLPSTCQVRGPGESCSDTALPHTQLQPEPQWRCRNRTFSVFQLSFMNLFYVAQLLD